MESIHSFFEILTWIVAIGFLLFGLDDLIFDFQYLGFLLSDRKKPQISLEELKFVPEQWIAVFVPAWNEGGVVNRMAEYAAKVLLYEKYDIFIGVYPNDPETMECVAKIEKICPRIHRVVLPHAGPTSKADCLNWIYQGMRVQEIPGIKEYSIVALHDSEDILHPLTLKVYNFHVPKVDMAQIPVFPLELPAWRYWVGNTYIDDFCEQHTKDILARQYMGGFVPSAGVGTAFNRRALEKLAAENGGTPFVLGSLTEDYEVGLRLVQLGFKAEFIDYPVDREVEVTLRSGEKKRIRVTEVVAVRENFPRTFITAVKQRSRWILGIVFQSWERTGWWGSFRQRYILFRDRRAPLTHFLTTVGWVVFAYGLFQLLIFQTPWAPYLFIRPLVDQGSYLWNIILADTCLMVYRIAQKIVSVQRILGFRQAFASIPRFFVSNLINLCATLRATKLFLEYKILGKPCVWTKTAHIFPEHEELQVYTASINDLLVDEGLISRDRLNQMLEERKGTDSLPLTMLRLGMLTEDQYIGVWSRYSGLSTRRIRPSKIPRDLLSLFPEKRSLELGALPVGRENQRIVIAFSEPPDPPILETLSSHFSAPLTPILAKPSGLRFSRNRAYPLLVLPPPKTQFFYEQVEKQYSIDPEQLNLAFDHQQETGQSLADVMVSMGLLNPKECQHLWAEFVGCPPLGEGSMVADLDFYKRMGRSFCWFHSLVPLQNQQVGTYVAPHPAMADWLKAKLGFEPRFVAALRRNVELAIAGMSEGFDPDQVMFERVSTNGLLTPEQVANIKTVRSVTRDPVSVMLAQLGMMSEEKIHQVFVELSDLPPAGVLGDSEVLRLSAVLQPGFSQRTGCFALEEVQGNITFGLTRLLSVSELNEIRMRLTGYPLFFRIMTWQQAVHLKTLIS